MGCICAKPATDPVKPKIVIHETSSIVQRSPNIATVKEEPLSDAPSASAPPCVSFDPSGSTSMFAPKDASAQSAVELYEVDLGANKSRALGTARETESKMDNEQNGVLVGQNGHVLVERSLIVNRVQDRLEVQYVREQAEAYGAVIEYLGELLDGGLRCSALVMEYRQMTLAEQVEDVYTKIISMGVSFDKGLTVAVDPTRLASRLLHQELLVQSPRPRRPSDVRRLSRSYSGIALYKPNANPQTNQYLQQNQQAIADLVIHSTSTNQPSQPSQVFFAQLLIGTKMTIPLAPHKP